ncbi:MAG: FecR domain-containing protein [Polyangiaceae bacterium]|nr:FecR domain-containing protein [Polyangiaceae bacterium]
MDRPMKAVRELSRKVAEISDATAESAEVLETARRRALQDVGGSRRSRGNGFRSWQVRLAFAVATAAAAAIVLWSGWLAQPSALEYTVDGSRGAIGAWIAAPSEPVSVRFSDGTKIELAAEARARVTRADEDGASVLLERGSLRANVVHQSDATRWSLHVGPFEIVVTGTELAVVWDPTLETLLVTMVEGRVVVTGPLLEGGRSLSAGERLKIDVRMQQITISAGPSAESSPPAVSSDVGSIKPAPSAPSAAPQELRAPAEEPSRKPESTPHPEATNAAAPGWRELAASGKPKEALEAAEREGFGGVLASASPADLLTLADAARYAGDFPKAKASLLAARQRGAKGRSAFLLGKLCADHLGSPGEAVAWLSTYLAEEPGGSLAEQALGRLIELKQRSGDTAGARASAETYLARYPNGAFAPLAKAALGN